MSYFPTGNTPKTAAAAYAAAAPTYPSSCKAGESLLVFDGGAWRRQKAGETFSSATSPPRQCKAVSAGSGPLCAEFRDAAANKKTCEKEFTWMRAPAFAAQYPARVADCVQKKADAYRDCLRRIPGTPEWIAWQKSRAPTDPYNIAIHDPEKHAAACQPWAKKPDQFACCLSLASVRGALTVPGQLDQAVRAQCIPPVNWTKIAMLGVGALLVAGVAKQAIKKRESR